MKIVLPENTEHNLILIPRFYPSDTVVLQLTNEATNAKEDVRNTYTIDNGYMLVNFDYEFTEKQRFSIKIYDESGVVFRGKILATSQETQNYKQTLNVYEY
jgi:hypothetical protein